MTQFCPSVPLSASVVILCDDFYAMRRTAFQTVVSCMQSVSHGGAKRDESLLKPVLDGSLWRAATHT